MLNANPNITALVFGASGRPGGSVARELLAHGGYRVRLLVRDPESPVIRELVQLGATTVTGHWRDLDSLVRAMEGVDFVFALTAARAGPVAEVRHGATIARAAKAAAVRHLIYSSVAGADRGTGIPFFESKRRVERRMLSQGIPCTIVAPVFFMENYLCPPLLNALCDGRLEMPLPAALRFQQLALMDFAACVRVILARPSDFLGRRVALASDELSGSLSAEILSFALGLPVRHVRIPLERVAEVQGVGIERMYRWIEDTGFRTDLEGTHALFPEVRFHSLADWARVQAWDEGSGAQERKIA